MPVWPSTAQSMPGTAATSLWVALPSPTCTSAITMRRAARAQARDRRARRGGGIARLDAGGLERGGVVGRRRRADAEQADLDAGGVDDLVGVEQPLAVPAVEVRRQQRDAGLLGQLSQQRQADRQIALARNQRGRPHPPERRREQAGAPLDLARVGRLAVAVRARMREEQVAAVEDQRRVRLGARAIELGRPARDAAQRMHRTAALLVVAGQVRRIQQRDRLAARRRGNGGCGRGRRRRRRRPFAGGRAPARRSRDQRARQQRRQPQASRGAHDHDTRRNHRPCPPPVRPPPMKRLRRSCHHTVRAETPRHAQA